MGAILTKPQNAHPRAKHMYTVNQNTAPIYVCNNVVKPNCILLNFRHTYTLRNWQQNNIKFISIS